MQYLLQDDKRPRNAIEAIKLWLEIPSEENRKKCRDTSNVVYDMANNSYDWDKISANIPDDGIIDIDHNSYIALCAAHTASLGVDINRANEKDEINIKRNTSTSTRNGAYAAVHNAFEYSNDINLFKDIWLINRQY